MAAHRWKHTFVTECKSSFLSRRCGGANCYVVTFFVNEWDEMFYSDFRISLQSHQNLRVFSAVFDSSVWLFQQTKPPFSRNKSIDFVQQFHWFCSTIPLTLFDDSIGIVYRNCRFSCFHPSFSPFVSGSLGLAGRLFIAWEAKRKNSVPLSLCVQIPYSKTPKDKESLRKLN